MNPTITQQQWLNVLNVISTPLIVCHGEKVRINASTEALIGYSESEVSSLESWCKKLYKNRWEDVVLLYKTDKKRGFREQRTIPVESKHAGLKWIQYCLIFHQEDEEVWELHDVTENYSKILQLEKQNKRLQDDLYKKTEELARAINMVLEARNGQNQNALKKELNQCIHATALVPEYDIHQLLIQLSKAQDRLEKSDWQAADSLIADVRKTLLGFL